MLLFPKIKGEATSEGNSSRASLGAIRYQEYYFRLRHLRLKVSNCQWNVDRRAKEVLSLNSGLENTKVTGGLEALRIRKTLAPVSIDLVSFDLYDTHANGITDQAGNIVNV